MSQDPVIDRTNQLLEALGGPSEAVRDEWKNTYRRIFIITTPDAGDAAIVRPLRRSEHVQLQKRIKNQEFPDKETFDLEVYKICMLWESVSDLCEFYAGFLQLATDNISTISGFVTDPEMQANLVARI